MPLQPLAHIPGKNMATISPSLIPPATNHRCLILSEELLKARLQRPSCVKILMPTLTDSLKIDGSLFAGFDARRFPRSFQSELPSPAACACRLGTKNGRYMIACEKKVGCCAQLLCKERCADVCRVRAHARCPPPQRWIQVARSEQSSSDQLGFGCKCFFCQSGMHPSKSHRCVLVPACMSPMCCIELD